MAIVGLVDFLAPDLEAMLERYARVRQCGRGARAHGLGRGQSVAAICEARGPADGSTLAAGLCRLLKKYSFRCSLEVFSSQLTELQPVIEENPEIGFTIAVMGWPIAVDEEEFARWKQNIGH